MTPAGRGSAQGAIEAAEASGYARGCTDGAMRALTAIADTLRAKGHDALADELLDEFSDEAD